MRGWFSLYCACAERMFTQWTAHGTQARARALHTSRANQSLALHARHSGGACTFSTACAHTRARAPARASAWRRSCRAPLTSFVPIFSQQPVAIVASGAFASSTSHATARACRVALARMHARAKMAAIQHIYIYIYALQRPWAKAQIRSRGNTPC